MFQTLHCFHHRQTNGKSPSKLELKETEILNSAGNSLLNLYRVESGVSFSPSFLSPTHSLIILGLKNQSFYTISLLSYVLHGHYVLIYIQNAWMYLKARLNRAIVRPTFSKLLYISSNVVINCTVNAVTTWERKKCRVDEYNGTKQVDLFVALNYRV